MLFKDYSQGALAQVSSTPYLKQLAATKRGMLSVIVSCPSSNVIPHPIPQECFVLPPRFTVSNRCTRDCWAFSYL